MPIDGGGKHGLGKWETVEVEREGGQATRGENERAQLGEECHLLSFPWAL